MLQKLLHGKGTLFEKPVHVRLRLRGGKRGNVPRADRKQHRGIARRELSGERRSCIRAEPRRGGNKPAERCTERFRAAALFQMQKVLNIADALPWAQPLGKADRRNLAEERLVVARSERCLPALRQRGGVQAFCKSCAAAASAASSGMPSIFSVEAARSERKLSLCSARRMSSICQARTRRPFR